MARPNGVPTWRSLTSRIEWPRVGSALRLSRRELELVRHIFDGKKLAAIAKEMKLALGTVKTYSQRIHLKLDVSDHPALRSARLSCEGVHAVFLKLPEAIPAD
ncbi:MAG: response regulator transcription factor, partial [Planctomycetes bacterium]|nr:response regulator transcription factor [Planctomycetota bacterium]